jgi:hypothetical protein
LPHFTPTIQIVVARPRLANSNAPFRAAIADSVAEKTLQGPEDGETRGEALGKLLEEVENKAWCNGTKRPTLCTVPYTRYLYRYTWVWLSRVKGGGDGKWKGEDGGKEEEQNQEDKGREEGEMVEKEGGREDGKKKEVGEKTAVHTVQTIRKKVSAGALIRSREASGLYS